MANSGVLLGGETLLTLAPPLVLTEARERCAGDVPGVLLKGGTLKALARLPQLLEERS